MKKAFLLLFVVFCFKSYAQNDQFLLFYLGGQSNMDGYGFVKDLPDSLDKTFKNVYIFHGNTGEDDKDNGGMGIWSELKPGHGVGFSSDGKENKYSDRFGVELSFVQQLQKKYPDKKIAIIKYSKGGTSIDSVAQRQFGCWEPDYRGKTRINQYDHFLLTIRNASSIKDINNDGKEDELIPTGILWMQGESDADCTEEIALRYHANLKRLMDLLRASLRYDDLPIVIGKISDSWNKKTGKVWEFGEIVQYAQEKFVKEDEKASIVRDTRYYKYSDPWHYDSNGYIDLGKRFAEEMAKLMK